MPCSRCTGLFLCHLWDTRDSHLIFINLDYIGVLMTDSNWHSLSSEEVLKRLETSFDGLSDSEASARLVNYGPNELSEAKHTSPLMLFLRQFTAFLKPSRRSLGIPSRIPSVSQSIIQYSLRSAMVR